MIVANAFNGTGAGAMAFLPNAARQMARLNVAVTSRFAVRKSQKQET